MPKRIRWAGIRKAVMADSPAASKRHRAPRRRLLRENRQAQPEISTKTPAKKVRMIPNHPRDRKKMAVLAENAAGAKYAYTGWQVLERCGNFTYIACKLKTGRTHQIRVHMASTGHPLAGDAVYGPKNCIKSLNGQCLHAKELGFVHPRTGEWMQFDSPLPPYFTEFLTRLRKEHRA